MTTTNDYYQAIQLADGIFHIYEPAGVHTTLIIGHEKAMLIDTGYGFGDLAGFVRTLTDKPLEVVLTHAHTDHSGGNFRFPVVYMNLVDAETYFWYESTQKKQMIEQLKRRRAEAGFQDVWPERFNMDAYVKQNLRQFESLDDGQIFDLGGRTEEIIFLPGHTKGSVVIFDSQTGLLFSGDNISDSLWIFFDASATLTAYTSKLREIAKMPIKGIIPSHHGRIFSPSIIDDQLRTIACIDPENDREFTHPRTGQKALKHREACRAVEDIAYIYVVYDRNKM